MDTQERIEATLARLGANRAILAKADEAGPPCSECRYCSPTRLKNVVRCCHPALVKQTFKAATWDATRHVLATIEEARSEDGLCGPEALLFETKSPSAFFLKSPLGLALLLFFGGALAVEAFSLLGH